MIFTFFVEELIGGIFRAKSPSLCCSCRLGSKKILILDNRVRIVLSSTPLSTNSCVPLSSCREFKYSRRARRSCCSCSNWALLLGCRPLVICHCPGVWHKSHRRRDAEDETRRFPSHALLLPMQTVHSAGGCLCVEASLHGDHAQLPGRSVATQRG